MILVGDVGGTKTRLALYQDEEGKLVRQQTETFASRDYEGLGEVVRIFLDKHKVTVKKSCFGVPGPIVNGEARATNLPWRVKEDQILRELGIPALKLVNDLVATASAVPYLTLKDVLVLHEGKGPAFLKNDNIDKKHGNEQEENDTICAVLAPGTGLGQAFLNIKSGRHSILASEGGHTDFAPTNELEVALFQYLKSKYERVSYERVLSGPGIVNIYNFLKDTGFAKEPPELTKQLKEEGPGKVISSYGRAGKYGLCVKALDVFASILGSQAGNLVLTLMVTGGVFLGGGISADNYKKLAEGAVVSSYLRKGRLSNLVEETPLYVILDDHAALLGAASVASKL